MRYVSVRQVHRLIGLNYPGGAPELAAALENFLCHAEAQGEKFPDLLLAHNLSGRRDREACELASVDADIVLERDIASGRVETVLKDYRVHTEFAREGEERRVVVHIELKYQDRTRWAIHVPLQALMKGFGDPEDGHQCYAHTIARLDADGKPETEYIYCGITSRNWLQRMAEHFRAARSGSNIRFHRAWREYQGRSDVLLGSELIVLNQTRARALSWEEWIVDRYRDENRSLNMIAGGEKGRRELQRLGYLARTDGSLEEWDAAVMNYARDHGRAGVPNLLIAGLWEDDAYYARVIEARSDTLGREQVRQIRYLASLNWPPEKICDEVGALNVDQVRRVLQGKTYLRMQ
ncbi:hypothetical protein [Hyphomicrobium sp.]|uniref:hypothetical protein n=1 Tax=Hyphomicrobium sp. TaxID=82 RepID=UPI000FB04A5B|nr:hypothetical protein [Hyphomicrobium sp.]RUP07823.1 MAG: hypothetical protein EKK38_17745 [Hyphomicrobium sp.]